MTLEITDRDGKRTRIFDISREPKPGERTATIIRGGVVQGRFAEITPLTFKEKISRLFHRGK